jgi:hypothetical protein
MKWPESQGLEPDRSEREFKVGLIIYEQLWAVEGRWLGVGRDDELQFIVRR